MGKNKLPSFVSILILTLITVVVWVGFSIYRAFSLSPSPSVPANISATLNPTLDTQTLNQIESRLFFSGSQVAEISIASASPTAKTTPTPTPLASPSTSPIASASATPTATP